MKRVFFIIAFSTATLFTNAQTIRYVTVTGAGAGTGTGSSWANASSDIVSNQDFNKIYKINKINPANPENLVKIVVQTKKKLYLCKNF